MTLKELSIGLSALSPFVLSIGIIIGILLYNKLDRVHKLTILYLVALLTVDVAGRFLGRTGNNLIMLLIYSFTELIIISSLYFRFLLSKKYLVLYCLMISGSIYILGEIFYYFILNDTKPEDFQPYAKVVDNFMIIILSLTFLNEKIGSFKESGWGYFRLNIVVLIFFTLNTLIFLPFNFLVNESSGLKFYFWTANTVAVLLFYSFLITEIWRNGRRKKTIEVK